MRLVRVVQVVWIAGFLSGTTTHVFDLVIGGVSTYEPFPIPLRVFWMSLTLLDPLVVVLLVLRRRASIVLGLAVILVDIAVNWTVFVTIGGLSLFGVVSQTAFATLLLATARPLWRWMRTGSGVPQHPRETPTASSAGAPVS